MDLYGADQPLICAKIPYEDVRCDRILIAAPILRENPLYAVDEQVQAMTVSDEKFSETHSGSAEHTPHLRAMVLTRREENRLGWLIPSVWPY